MNTREILLTDRLILRPLEEADILGVHRWAHDQANVRYMSWGPNDLEQTSQFVESAKPGKDFAVVLKETYQLIGSCGIYPDSSQAELGWILHKEYWQQGYGTELGQALIRYGFEDLGLHRIYAPCAAANIGSYRLMERLGMRREACHKKAFPDRIEGGWLDQLVYALLKEEYDLNKTGR